MNVTRDFIYDTKTRNISFKKTAVDLKKLDIKNNLFMLKLYDRSLQGIDPHSKILPEEIQMKIINECIRNPWYYLREVARIPDQGGPPMPFLLHRGNLAMVFLFLLGIDNYLTIPRQQGRFGSL